MRTSVYGGWLCIGGVFVAAACGSSAKDSGFGSSSGASSSGSTGSSGGSTGSSGGVGSFGDDGGGPSSSGGTTCSPNPANYDIPGNNCDDDGNGTVDDVPHCDSSLSLSGTAHDFANALGICQDADATKWGIVSATFTAGYGAGNPNVGQHALLPKFGNVIKPREGARLGVLSSGYAYECDDPNPGSTCTGSGQMDPYFKGNQAGFGAGTAPPGYPKAAAGCTNDKSVFDAIGVKLQIKVPANAQGLQFDFDFYSGEWPEYVCTNFNDSFVAWLNSTAFSGTGGDLNISFDAKNNPVSVNNGFFDRCTPNSTTGCAPGGKVGSAACAGGAPGGKVGSAACAGGASELAGTGFDNQGPWCTTTSTGGGATGWLTTKAPVKQAETITIQYIIWDTGDQNWDSRS